MKRFCIALIAAGVVIGCENSAPPTAAEHRISAAVIPGAHGPQSPAGPATRGTGYEIVRGTLYFPPGTSVQVIACPSGKKAVAAGNVVPDGGVEYLSASGMITSSGDAGGLRGGGGSDGASMEGFVICVNP